MIYLIHIQMYYIYMMFSSSLNILRYGLLVKSECADNLVASNYHGQDLPGSIGYNEISILRFYEIQYTKNFAKIFQLLPNPILTEDQLRLLKYDNIISGKYKSNAQIGLPSKRIFAREVLKYSYMWKDGGQFSTSKYNLKRNNKE